MIGAMALKLDMYKAYDRLEWDFVTGVLSSNGFPESMVKLIYRCISMVSYQVMVNRQPSRVIVPERGLYQGDPLSPYFFNLCVDVFSGLLKEAGRNKTIHGIQLARKAYIISHLFFADDNLLFVRANENEADCVMNILKVYQESSGQVVNLDKSEVSFTSKCAR